uniref:Uncharacterized protein MANES_01G135100 n=1 Tax=Rhizophora mucronata TaxID=61149 RepID=A0A2P2LS69_RHIMU
MQAHLSWQRSDDKDITQGLSLATKLGYVLWISSTSINTNNNRSHLELLRSINILQIPASQ